MAGNSSEPGRSVTGRALAVLAAFDLGHPSLSLSELARRAELPLATAHRLVAELETWGAVERDADGQYQVGRRLWEIGMLWPSYARMRELAVPFMQDLYEATRENVHVAVRVGYEALYLEKLTGHRSVPIISRSGSRLPMHATGVGKALLAYSTPDFVAAYVDRPLERPTPYTLVEPGRLARDLADVRERGYAVTREEMTLGSCSVATPVREDGVAVAALGLVVHSVRADVDRLVPALRRATAGLEQRLAETADDPYPGLVHDFPRVQARRRGGAERGRNGTDGTSGQRK